MRILLIASAFNSLTQRVFAELGERGHRVSVETAVDGSMADTVQRLDPELIIAPMLRTAIPREVWSSRVCLVVHPGPVGDRGPSSLDWAVLGDERCWGVTVLQAEAEMDAGPVWASVPCELPSVAKSDLYRNEVSDAALTAVLLAVDRFATRTHVPRRQSSAKSVGGVRWRSSMGQSPRRIDWASDTTATVTRKLRAADSRPGVLDDFLDGEWYLHGGWPEDTLRGAPGRIVATREGAVCRATVDGAVWIPQLRRRSGPDGPRSFPLPATVALGELCPDVPESPAPLLLPSGRRTWAEIRYEEKGEAGFLRFSFPGGAMSTAHCQRLLAAYRFACTRPTSVLVLGGARDFFSNGIHLNVIEAADDPGAETWANINAIDDLVEAVLTTTDRTTVAALAGNAAAGGVMLAIASDEVWCRNGTVLNPHYRQMGLHGSEYWTYSLPRRVGEAESQRLMDRALPVTAARACELGLADEVLHCAPSDFGRAVEHRALRLASSPATAERLGKKKAERERAEAAKPLSAYRRQELTHMHRTCFDLREPYHALRRAFVRKEEPAPSGAPGEQPGPGVSGVPRPG